VLIHPFCNNIGLIWFKAIQRHQNRPEMMQMVLRPRD